MELPSTSSAQTALPVRATPRSHHFNTLSIDPPYFVGLQAHPEFFTRPPNPSPPFLGLIAAACGPDSDVLEQQMTQQLQMFHRRTPRRQ